MEPPFAYLQFYRNQRGIQRIDARCHKAFESEVIVVVQVSVDSGNSSEVSLSLVIDPNDFIVRTNRVPDIRNYLIDDLASRLQEMKASSAIRLNPSIAKPIVDLADG